MKFLIVLATVTVTVLSGCAPIMLTNPQGNSNLQRDLGSCELKATRHDGDYGSFFEEGMRRRELTLRCMEALGYEPTACYAEQLCESR